MKSIMILTESGIEHRYIPLNLRTLKSVVNFLSLDENKTIIYRDGFLTKRKNDELN
jgi:hypothetical protein